MLLLGKYERYVPDDAGGTVAQTRVQGIKITHTHTNTYTLFHTNTHTHHPYPSPYIPIGIKVLSLGGGPHAWPHRPAIQAYPTKAAGKERAHNVRLCQNIKERVQVSGYASYIIIHIYIHTYIQKYITYTLIGMTLGGRL
jgi:hypothetical protein